MYITANHISTKSFAPYGSIISPDDEIERLSRMTGHTENNANQGTAIKITSVSTVENTSTSNVPNINIFRCFVRKIIKKDQDISVVVPILEQHPNSSQTFIPMGISNSNISHVVVVALRDPKNPNQPDLSTVKAFLCKGNQGVTYGLGIWHAPMITLATRLETKFVDFAVVIYEDKVHPELNCVEHYHEDPLYITIDSSYSNL
ncbi:similar to Saccharomyces cerevisiae YIR032C DAL3 Ureidoglycolate hydrolase, converts ureidoglycolate to glyoxylate and urea in the third step of allantoin degradation [Maudiozyma barnettii]|uniref:Similar to Saccharomyces cerevisiae YIR032C DAL3 Ureidoglycolate hydrolase, converts ureidoglycolate to glyoxylate and urea in the third step of allantoin degradation n=1 Tax=Maudiozyma barnettii TaxID=61262 RepID=A0A8H2VGL5_9SACH|nr:ureidoglycolate hydrolase [Kazachstania barnettii]CAB4255200.1 similar to Saccharomyces cerevisiae YIR032C DAL3 Ureidoglycolate hydrolase, converts ureidoglycolate to glyoxylate and urea in the third step of allantoin degradation [Kazachstania barnettii]CAD1783489.1 similar to Saccharomyces cerevisiae YIR032C DAL3 Ureidoglycolate hydrolase, converts ureidoglycolate to glyoxylate and urea in the third step of allantoin degradation [Kazachstania barnettii]